MLKCKMTALTATVVVFASPSVQAANLEELVRTPRLTPLVSTPLNSDNLTGKAQLRRGGSGARSGGGRGMRGGMRGSGSRGMRSSGGRSAHSGGNRGFRGEQRGASNRGVRGGGRNFGNRGNFRGDRNLNRGYRDNRNFRGDRNSRGRNFRGNRGRNFGLGFAGGLILGSAAYGYPGYNYSSYGYPTYGYPNYGYPVYGFQGGYERCRYRGNYYSASFCYNFPYGYRREYLSGYGPEGNNHRHYHGEHCARDRRHHGYYRGH